MRRTQAANNAAALLLGFVGVGRQREKGSVEIRLNFSSAPEREGAISRMFARAFADVRFIDERVSLASVSRAIRYRQVGLPPVFQPQYSIFKDASDCIAEMVLATDERARGSIGGMHIAECDRDMGTTYSHLSSLKRLSQGKKKHCDKNRKATPFRASQVVDTHRLYIASNGFNPLSCLPETANKAQFFASIKRRCPFQMRWHVRKFRQIV